MKRSYRSFKILYYCYTNINRKRHYLFMKEIFYIRKLFFSYSLCLSRIDDVFWHTSKYYNGNYCTLDASIPPPSILNKQTKLQSTSDTRWMSILLLRNDDDRFTVDDLMIGNSVHVGHVFIPVVFFSLERKLLRVPTSL